MAYGSGFGNNLPPWKPMAMQTPPPVPSSAAPGPISDYNAGQLRNLTHSEPGQMPAGGAARPPISRQAPINSSIGQMTPRSAGLGGATSPNPISLTKFENFVRPNTAFTPQATVNTPGLVEGMANTPRSMGPLFSGSVPPSAYSTYLANGGVLPPEAPKPVADLSGMRGNPGSTVGYSMGGGQPPRSPGAPFAVPPAGGGGDMGGSMEEARNLSRAAGVVGSLARGPGLAFASIAGPAVYKEAMDPHSEFGATWRNAGEAIGREPSIAGKVGATVAAAPFVIGTGIKAGLRPFVNFANEAIGSGSKAFASSASAAPATTTPAVPPAPPPAIPPAATPPANPDQPRTVSPGPQDQSLSARYPDRFKGLNFANAVNGSANSNRIPLSPEERLYNAEVIKGIQLENRSRELANMDRYRATQLHDRAALQTLSASDGRGLNQGLAREEANPESKADAFKQQLAMIDERRNAVTNALFDPNNPDVAGRVLNSRQKDRDYKALLKALGLAAPTYEEDMQSDYGLKYDPKTGYFSKPK